MDVIIRKEFVNNVQQLQKLVRKLKRSEKRIGTANDTILFRQQLTTDIIGGSGIVQRLTEISNQHRNKAIDAQDEKMLSDSLQFIHQFTDIQSQLESDMQSQKPVYNETYTVVENTDDSGSTGLQSQNYDEQQQKQEMKSLGLIGLHADIADSEKRLDKIIKVENNILFVMKIEEDVHELREAFEDLDELVNDQQTDIDVIVKNVEQARDDVTQGRQHLETADKHMSAARKKQLIVLCCCLIALTLLFSLLGGFGVFN